MIYNGSYVSPIGNILIKADEESLLSIAFGEDDTKGNTYFSAIIEDTKKQFDLYFSKKLRQFSLPLNLSSSEFQGKVLDEVKKIPFGEIVTYTQLAQRLGTVKLTRAVANANASNPFLIIIPCHRVVGKNGSMTGYAGEIWRKEWLLKHENSLILGL
jgi:methylated-DNA-[protein]-cysteine S-methyltransferase